MPKANGASTGQASGRLVVKVTCNTRFQLSAKEKYLQRRVQVSEEFPEEREKFNSRPAGFLAYM